MRCPTLRELPPPPAGRTGWPWTAESEQLLETMPSGDPWPRVSIVTPSYNQGQFIEETIRSVLLQGYPNLEYIIMDGGSTDGSVEIIRKYEPWLAYWVSERDNGQSEAINKGWVRATGEITSWLNSDDSYKSRTLAHVVIEMQRGNVDIIYGNCKLVRADGSLIRLIEPPSVTLRNLVSHWQRQDGIPPQPSIFFRRSVLACVGLLNTQLNYAMDYDLWLRMTSAGFHFHYLNCTLASYVIHEDSKTSKGWRAFHSEWRQVNAPYRKQFGFAQRVRWAWNEWRHFNLDVPIQKNQRELFELGWSDPGRGWLAQHLLIALLARPAILRDRGIQSLVLKALLGARYHQRLKAAIGYVRADDE